MVGLLYLFALAGGLVLVGGAVGVARAIMWPGRKTLAVALARGEPQDPADLGLAAEAVTWTLARGVESPGWIIAGRRPDGPAMLILHGHRNSRYGALRRAARFVEFASKVVVFDLPGHGDARGGRCTLGAQEHEDVLRVIEQLGEDRVVLFGSSMGAGIALATAWRSGRVVGVIAEAPFRRWHEPVVRRMRMARYPALLVPLAGLLMRAMGVKLGYDRAADARRLHCPLLLLHARGDPVSPFDAARAIAAAAPRSRVVAFDDEGHGDLAEVDEARYRESVRAFFAELVQSGVCTGARP